MKKLLIALLLLPSLCFADVIEWDQVDGAAGYKVIYFNSLNRFSHDAGNALSCNISELNLSEEQTYHIYVVPYDSNGKTGIASETVDFSLVEKSAKLPATKIKIKKN